MIIIENSKRKLAGKKTIFRFNELFFPQFLASHALEGLDSHVLSKT